MITMATLTVTTTDDVVDAGDGVLSLREAVAQSNATTTVDTINFASFIEGQTLTLYGGALTLSRDVIVDGDQNNDGREVNLSGGYRNVPNYGRYGNRLFNIAGGETEATIHDLTF